MCVKLWGSDKTVAGLETAGHHIYHHLASLTSSAESSCGENGDQTIDFYWRLLWTVKLWLIISTKRFYWSPVTCLSSSGLLYLEFQIKHDFNGQTNWLTGGRNVLYSAEVDAREDHSDNTTGPIYSTNATLYSNYTCKLL